MQKKCENGLNFYENFFENSFLNALKGTKVFEKTIHSPVPSVFIGSKQGGILLCKAIMLENAFKNIEDAAAEMAEEMEEAVENILQNQQNTKIKQRHLLTISQETDFTNLQTQSSIFYLLELAKRGEILINFLVVQSDQTIFNPIPSEIESRIFDLNTIHLRNPEMWEVEKILQNLSLPHKPENITRNYEAIQTLCYNV